MEDERFSLKGWNFKTWAVKNKESLKLILAGTVGLLSALVTDPPPVWSAFLGMLITGASKIAVDTLDYWQSK